jgi:hypothetical protein
MELIIDGLLIVAVLLSYLIYGAPSETWCCVQHGQPSCSICNGEETYSGDTFPVGMIIKMPSADDIPGWMSLDGRLLRRSEYPELFRAIGPPYNEVAFDSEVFRLPTMTNTIIKVSHVEKL